MTVVIDPELGSDSGTTLRSLINGVRQQLADRENINILSTDIDETTTTLQFDQALSDVTRGTRISINGETVYVWSTDDANRNVTVQRGFQSIATDHSAGTVVSINGRSDQQIIDAINDELSVLSSSGLYQMKSVEGVVTGWAETYPVEVTGETSIYDVQMQDSFLRDWRHFPGATYSTIDSSVRFNDNDYFSGNRFRVLYRSGFKPLVTPDDDVQTTSGLHAEAADILKWGACDALTTGDEFRRNDYTSQGDTRRPSEVPYRAVALAQVAFRQRHDSRLSEEKDRLRRHFPIVKNGW